MNLQAFTSKAPRGVPPIAPQVDQVAIQRKNAGKALRIGPIDRKPGVEPMPLEDLLSLEDHRNPGRREYEHGAEDRALLGIDRLGLGRIDLRREPCAAVGVGVMRLGEDDPAQGIAAVTAFDGCPDHLQVAVLIVELAEDSAGLSDETRIPLAVEARAAGDGG